MTIDTSALVAILLGEDEGPRLSLAMAADGLRNISALSLLETSIVLESKRGAEAVLELESLIHDLDIRIIPFDADQATNAFSAWRRFGKGRHPAALNLGDCCSYAVATARGDALLFKGSDFEKTDIRKASY